MKYWVNKNQTIIINCSDGAFLASAIVSMVNTNVAWMVSLSFFVFISLENFYIQYLWKRQGIQLVVTSQPTIYSEQSNEQERLLTRERLPNDQAGTETALATC